MAEPILVARDITVQFPGTSQTAVADADLVVDEGAAIGLVGESGSGKTTLGRVLVGALKPQAGTVEVAGRPWRSVKRTDELRSAVQMIFQDPYASLNPMLTPRQAVAEVFRIWHGMNNAQASRRATEVLQEVGLSGQVIDRRPKRLSGGQCQRVGIARALACEPRLLIADEPTSSLDVSVQAQILNLLLDLRERRGLALLLISHDLSVVSYITEVAAVMYRGRIVERAKTDVLMTNPAHPYTRALVDSIPGGDAPPRLIQNEVEDTGCVFARRCPEMQPDCLVGLVPPHRVGERVVACLHPLAADGIHAGEEAGATG